MLLVSICATLLLSGFFSGSEIAFISASKLGIELKRSDGSRRGRILAAFYDKPEQFLAVMLVGNNIVLVIFTYLMSVVLEPFLSPVIPSLFLLGLIQTILITGVVLLFGEYLPKTIFRLYSNQLLYAFTDVLWFFKMILGLPAAIMKGLSTFFLTYVLRVTTKENNIHLTRYDLEEFVEGQAEESEEELETEMFKNALHLKKTKVRECMVPRNEIQHIDISADIEELSRLFQDTKHSRLLVTDGDLDEILGYVHHQQLIKAPTSIRRILLTIDLVPEAMSVQDVMLRFIREGNNMAYVVDEYGGTSGLITLEDTLEEIFGEIEDEHDAEQHIEEELGERRYRLSGRLELHYVNERFPGLDIPEGEFTTLSGYIVMTEGNIPKEGEELTIGHHVFYIEKVGDTKVETVVVEVRDKDNSSPDE